MDAKRDNAEGSAGTCDTFQRSKRAFVFFLLGVFNFLRSQETKRIVFPIDAYCATQPAPVSARGLDKGLAVPTRLPDRPHLLGPAPLAQTLSRYASINRFILTISIYLLYFKISI